MKTASIPMMMAILTGSSALSIDFLNYEQVSRQLFESSAPVEQAITVGKLPGSVLEPDIVFVCQDGCTYQKGEITAYTLAKPTIFLLSFGRRTIRKQFCFLVTDVYFYPLSHKLV